MKQDWEKTPVTSLSTHESNANDVHVEYQNATIKSNSPSIRNDVSNCIHTNHDAHFPNEIEALLAATFEQPKRRIKDGRISSRVQGVPSSWPFQDESINNKDLPHIPKHEIISRKLVIGEDGLISETHREELWIVVDDIVYDCSNFVHDHPGGQQVILSFVGEDCSWQFWRFHSRDIMDQYGKKLRIGRTGDVPNRFQEPSKYVGLSRLGHDEYY